MIRGFISSLIILAIGLAFLSLTAPGMEKPNATEIKAELEPPDYQDRAPVIPGAIAENRTMEPADYQDRAPAIPGFCVWASLATILLTGVIICSGKFDKFCKR